MEDDARLTGAHWRRMASLGDALPDLDGVSSEEIMLARLTILVEGGDPADPVAVEDLLSLDLPSYMQRTQPVAEQLADGPEILPSDGGYRVGEVEVVQLRGYHRRLLLASVGDMIAERRLLQTMTGQSTEALDKLPIGQYQALMRACGFLIAEVWMHISD